MTELVTGTLMHRREGAGVEGAHVSTNETLLRQATVEVQQQSDKLGQIVQSVLAQSNPQHRPSAREILDEHFPEPPTSTVLTTPTPEPFLCPITFEIMRDPVICADGHTYERTAIEHWFSRENRTSPLTNATLSSLNLIPNYGLRASIDLFRETAGDIES